MPRWKAPAEMRHRKKKRFPPPHQFQNFIKNRPAHICPRTIARICCIKDGHIRRFPFRIITDIKRVIASVIPRKEQFFPFTGNIVPHGTGTMPAPPPAETEIPFQFQFGRCRIKNHRVPRFFFHLPVCLVRQKHGSRKAERLEISDRPRMIPVRMGDEKVFCSCNLLRCEIRYPVQSVRRSSRIHDKSVAPSFNKKAAASEITAAACNCYLHIHLH